MPVILAMEGGGTHSTAGLYAEGGQLIAERQAGPANPVSMGVNACLESLAALARPLLDQADAPVSLLAAVAGAKTAALQKTIAEGLRGALDLNCVSVCPDLHPILWANAPDSPGMLALAGTGSGVMAKDAAGQWLHLGGRGPLLGDQGSAWALAASALRAAFDAVDEGYPPGALMNTLVRGACVDTMDALPAWTAAAGKDRLAALAQPVASLAEQGDVLAQRCIQMQAVALARLARAAKERLRLPPETPLFLAGGLLTGCQEFQRAFLRAVADWNAGVRPCAPRLLGHGAVHAVALLCPPPPWITPCAGASAPRQAAASPNKAKHDPREARAGELPPTEQTALNGQPLDQLTAKGIVQRMNQLDAAVIPAIAAQTDTLAALVEKAAKTLMNGGRIIYVGAGTSGRLGALDAAECPPTFGVTPDRVVALIAGGDAALRRSIEGAEDDVHQAAADIVAINAGEKDLLIGIAASGGTPYVIAALRAAESRGAATAMLCCNPAVDPALAGVVVALDTGPEALPGSTRLKAGTATKLALNIISTGAMALSGYVYQGMMTHMRPANDKLRRRAARIVAAVTGADEEAVESLLREADWRIPVAIIMAVKKVDARAAEALLERAGGRLRDVL